MATLPGVWPDATGRRTRCPVFWLPELRGSWAAAAAALEHPHTRQVRPIVFDHDLAQGRVLAHLNHRLVQMALRLLRAEVWVPEGTRKLHRVTARLVPNSALETSAIILHARLLVLGSDYQRLHEELVAAGGVLHGGRLERLNVGEIQRALDAALPVAASEVMQQRLAARWATDEAALLAALDARAKERTESLQKLLAERAEKEISDTVAMLSELRAGIEAELRQPEVMQLSLFTSAEQQQVEDNLHFLERRLAEIPGEMERETRAIRERFANPTPRLFPVAITNLVPERLG